MSDGFNLRHASATLSVALLALVPVVGEAAGVKAEIPFSFSVNGATLPPGSYLVTPNLPTPGAIVVRGATRTVITMLSPRGASENHKPRLVFHRYGDDYFLRQVWSDGGSGHDLRETSQERDRREGRGGEVAVAPEQIVVPVL
jgi:hypothetical protein